MRNLISARLPTFLCLLVFLGSASLLSSESQQNRGVAPLKPDALFSRISPSVFVIEAVDLQGNTIALGSGVAVAKDLLVTNKHVVSEAVTVRVSRGDRQWTAIEKTPHPTEDLTLLSVANLNAGVVTLRDGEPRIGERAYAIGSPEGFELTLSDGLISGIRELTPGHVLIQTTAAISHGSSGGGLFDEYGRLLGITTFIFADGQNLNFAVPTRWVAELTRFVSPNGPEQVQRQIAALSDDTRRKARSLYEQAALAHDKNDIDHLIPLLMQLRQFNIEAFDDLGEAYLRKGDYTLAIDFLEKAVSIDATDAITWGSLALSYHYLHNAQDALRAALQSVRLNPADAVSWDTLSYAYEDMGDIASAILAVEREARVAPDSIQAWWDLAVLYDRVGSKERFQTAVEHLRAIDPERAQSLTDSGKSKDSPRRRFP